MTRSAAVAAGRAEAILLDALGTLVGIVPPGGPLMRLLAERHGVRVDGEAVGRALRAEMAHYRAHCLGAGDPASLAVLRAECAEVIARELGAPVAAIDRAELTQTLLDALRFAAYPEVAEVLRRLRAGGARLIVVSNWDISLHEALAQARLSPLIDGVVSSAAVGAAKPSPAIFRAGLALAGVPADRALHIGDSYEEDVAGARASGIASILLTRPPARAGGLLAAGGPGGMSPAAVAASGTPTISSLTELVDP